MHLLWCLNAFDMIEIQKKHKLLGKDKAGDGKDVCVISTYTYIKKIIKHQGMGKKFLR